MDATGQTLDVNYEIPGYSDAAALAAEVNDLRAQLAAQDKQMALERDLAIRVHRSRATAILASPALQLVFDTDNPERASNVADIEMTDILAAVFQTEVSTNALPENFADYVGRDIRAALHPDAGGGVKTAQQANEALERSERDEAFSITRALLIASRNPKKADKTPAALRKSRYLLSIALDSAKPVFASAKEARASAKAEERAAEWTVRTSAAAMSFDLIAGGQEAMQSYLEAIVRADRTFLINQINTRWPEMQSLFERIGKGDPKKLKPQEVEQIDAVFQHIWEQLGEAKKSELRYSPPYQNWFEVLLPALRILDPGRKEGEQYTYFPPPIQNYHPAPRHERPLKLSGLGGLLIEESFSDYKYKEYSNEEYKKY